MVETKKIMWMVKKDLLVLWRHKPRLISLFLFPIIMITLFGYGMGGTISNVPVVVVDQSQGPLTDATLAAIKGNSIYDVKDITTDPTKGLQDVQNGLAKAAIILPTDYDNLNTTSQKSIVVDVDSSDQLAASAIIPTTQGIFNGINQQIAAQKLQNTSSVAVTTTQVAGSSANPFQSILNTINLQINKLYGNITYLDFLVPAIIGMTVLFGCVFGMGEIVAGERERGELARLFMTPTSVATVLGGKIISKLVQETGRGIILIVAAIILFGIIINGSMLLTIFLIILGALCFIGFGIMISARVSSQEDFMQSVMPITMPMMFVSGVFYPIETMPWIFQKIAYILPLTYVNDALRAVMLKGVGIGAIWVDVVVLIGFTALFFALGVTQFNRDI
ncbi:ABC transporter permease [Methanobacterium sp.]|uniref:ABC transporter permease n=3 Tax=Methanobacterium sp. TaxID=2164 RepID=UPI003C746D50